MTPVVEDRARTAPGYVGATILWLLGMLVLAVVAVLFALFAPEVVPSHYGSGGRVDDVSSRASNLAVLVPIGLGIPVLLGIRWPWGRHPALLNIPHKQEWIEAGRREGLTDRVVIFLRRIGAVMALLIALVLGQMLRDGRAAGTASAPPWLFPVALVVFVVGTVLSIILLLRSLDRVDLEE